MCSVEPGQKLDGYIIECVLANGGMATVCRGKEMGSGRKVAIKVPHIEAESDVAFFERFRREEEIGRKLEHPGVAKVFGDGARSRVYIVTEWAEGKPLRTLMHEQGKLPAERAIRIALRICEAVAYIHKHGVIHRDLKPDNIIVDANDNIKLIDFGIASNAGSRRLTFGKLSATMGTPDYISPEQVKGKRGDARSDLYAIGVMLYEMLTGKAPFEGPNSLAIMNARLLRDAVPPREIEQSISPQLQRVIRHAMERNPDKRYANAGELAYDLTHLEAVSVEETVNVRDGRPWPCGAISYVPLALIPILIFTLLMLVAKLP
jgi:serine/threonine-protein kinase